MAALTAAICLGSGHVLAGDGSGGDLTAAQQALAQAQLHALQAKEQVAEAGTQLADARAELAQAKAQLAAMQAKIASLDAEVSSDQAEVTELQGQIAQDKQQLEAFVRASYESGGSQTTIEYLVDAQSVSDLVARISEVDHVAAAGNLLVNQINAAQTREQHLLSAALEARSQEQAAEQQAATQEVVIANDEASDAVLLANDQVAASRAEQAASSAQTEYDLISEYDTEYADAAEALALARADDTIFSPIPGPVFTEDTDLTLASGENAQTIDAFLAGTDLAGLGSAYMQAEESYGVSARYLVAHSIEEFGLGDERHRPAEAQPLRLRRRRQQPLRRRHELPELHRLHPLRRPGGEAELPHTRRRLLPRADAPRHERRLRLRPLLGVPDCGHRPDGAPPQLSSGGAVGSPASIPRGKRRIPARVVIDLTGRGW